MCNHCETGVILSNGFCDTCGNNAMDDVIFYEEYVSWQESMQDDDPLTDYEKWCKIANV